LAISLAICGALIESRVQSLGMVLIRRRCYLRLISRRLRWRLREDLVLPIYICILRKVSHLRVLTVG
jgi:hypothetical protein